MNRKLAYACFAVFFAGSLVAQADPAQLLAAGDEALAKFNLDKATAAYRSALKLAPNSCEANWKLARAIVDRGMLEKESTQQRLDYVEAQDYARTAVRLNPNEAKAHAYLAIVVGKLALYQGGRAKVDLSKEVKTEAEKAIALNPNEDLGYHVLGVWNREMAELNWLLRTVAEVVYGRFPPASREEALKNLRHASELAPAAVAHKVETGITLASARHWEEAKQTLESALQMPRTWVTDDCYKQQAKLILDRVNHQLR